MIITDKCPNCGSVLLFEPERQKLYCEHCETTAEPSDKSVLREVEEPAAGGEGGRNCVVCGGSLEIPDGNAISLLCPYCGSPNLLKERFTGEYEPDRILPFYISKRRAQEILRERLKAHKFGPSRRVVETSLEAVRGTYIPYWLFDYHAEPEAHYACTRVKTRSDSEYHYTITDHYDVYRRLKLDYSMIPADALKEMDDRVSYDLEPFDYSGLKPAEEAYLMGFFAKKYDVDREEGERTAGQKLKRFLDEEIAETVLGYTTMTKVSGNYHEQKTDQKYGMLPVWIALLRYEKKEIPVFVNGQTGKVIGKLPLSMHKIAATFAVSSAVWFLIISLVMLVR